MYNDDDVYLNKLKSEEWVNYSTYLSFDKIKKYSPSFKYLVENFDNLEKYCTEEVITHVLSKPNLFESKNAKNLERNGVPPKYMREFLLKLFNIEEASRDVYNEHYKITFKNYNTEELEDFVPYFSGKQTLNECLPVHYLNESGVLALKEILWMLNFSLSNIEFSPLLTKLTSVILLFCNNIETYEIMSKLIDMNYNVKETFKIRWHVRFNYNDHLKIITSMNETINELSKTGKEAFDHLSKINFPPEKLYEDLCYGFNLNYLNFYGIIRLLPFFLIDGIKSIYRLSYAIVKTLKDDIIKIENPDKVIDEIRKLTMNNPNFDINQLFSLSYTFGLTRYNNKYDFQPLPEMDLFKGKRNNYYLPKFDIASNIISKYEIIRLWEKLPIDIKTKDAIKIFDTKKDGYNLQTILGLNDKYNKDSNILLLIQTTGDEIFGGVISNLIRNTQGKFEQPDTGLLVQIKPEMMIYNPLDDQIIYTDNECLMFGNGKNGPAFRFDKDLNKGFSYASECFNNKSLVENSNGGFQIVAVEIYMLE